MGNKILNTLRVALLNPVTLIEKKDEREVLCVCLCIIEREIVKRKQKN